MHTFLRSFIPSQTKNDRFRLDWMPYFAMNSGLMKYADDSYDRKYGVVAAES